MDICGFRSTGFAQISSSKHQPFDLRFYLKLFENQPFSAVMRFIDFSGKWAIVGQHNTDLQGSTNPAHHGDGPTHQVNDYNHQSGILDNDIR
jgi:hypothetical protein